MTALPQNPWSSLTEHIETAVLEAARAMLKRVQQPADIKVWRKADSSLVLSLDLESQDILRARLAKILPCVSEEDESSHSLIHNTKDYFLLDPLDGTSSCKRFLNAEGGQLGFGPLVGLVQASQLVATMFFHLPRRTLFVALKGLGNYRAYLGSDWGSASPQYQKIPTPPFPPLSECAALFYPGIGGEMNFIFHLRTNDKIENAYRFGGFANDCTRLAEGFEQVQVQYSVKPWDYVALLFAHEAGYSITVDPLDKAEDFKAWKIEKNNPVIVCPPQLRQELLTTLKQLPK